MLNRIPFNAHRQFSRKRLKNRVEKLFRGREDPPKDSGRTHSGSLQKRKNFTEQTGNRGESASLEPGHNCRVVNWLNMGVDQPSS